MSGSGHGRAQSKARPLETGWTSSWWGWSPGPGAARGWGSCETQCPALLTLAGSEHEKQARVSGIPPCTRRRREAGTGRQGDGLTWGQCRSSWQCRGDWARDPCRTGRTAGLVQAWGSNTSEVWVRGGCRPVPEDKEQHSRIFHSIPRQERCSLAPAETLRSAGSGRPTSLCPAR